MLTTPNNAAIADSSELFLKHHQLLSNRLRAVNEMMYPPEAKKTLRTFSTPEVSKLLGVTQSNLRRLVSEQKGPSPLRLDNSHRAYSLEQINELRHYFASIHADQAQQFTPTRDPAEHLQVLAVANFKGGSAKTTTCLHLSHYLALHGYRVLVIDLDPQASLSTMFGFQPELNIAENETIYACLRYDEYRRSINEVIQPTYFEGIDIIPGNLEVMEFEFTSPLAVANSSGRAGELFFNRLHDALGEIDQHYDVVLLDSPPTLGYLSLVSFFASTGIVITAHPAMVDINSMNQFLKMFGELTSVFKDRGANLSKDSLNYCLTRNDPNNQAHVQGASLLRSLFNDHVYTPTALLSVAVEQAGLAKKSVYELQAGEVQRNTLLRARDAMDHVNEAIVQTLWYNWGRTERKAA